MSSRSSSLDGCRVRNISLRLWEGRSATAVWTARQQGRPLVAGPVDQRVDDVFEEGPVGDAAAVAAQRVGGVELGERPAAVLGDQGGELAPDGFEQG